MKLTKKIVQEPKQVQPIRQAGDEYKGKNKKFITDVDGNRIDVGIVSDNVKLTKTYKFQVEK